ncbi:sugar phosphate isomerase/epimerase family protein [Herbiconiux sp. KACC 21604]|uniref:sugar phosphate isomerase/epimerase family protein n=1 Tax=unclassified Herbiconiux TaxID=2618217 RepID=UPI001492CC07|nr:sugar phosphate isomerase/epimerase family protein [Herbiconiux sp. SALV-R1]QJU55239.1 sugar phosphate isomerase/epimerase [Herbiconiux sp. SALV-R1]WPO86405.1 sugar phosphate isomerase/epimerase family protein [Herbiconiux sp. KACC 21604]
MDDDVDTTPRIALGSWAFAFGPFEPAPWSWQRFLDYSARTGYDGVEINGFRPHPHDEDYDRRAAAELASSIRDLGLGVSAFAPDLTATPPGLAAERDYLSRMRSIAAFAQAAGITTVRVDTISPPAEAQAAEVPDYARLVSTWRTSAELLGDHGVRLVWEFEPGFWLNRPSEIRRLADDVAHDNFGILFDTSHAHAIAAHGARQGRDPELLAGGAAELARELREHVRHLHLIDGDGSLHDGETSNHLPFGAGEIDFAAVLDALGSAAADAAWWTVDFCFCPTTETDAATAVPLLAALRDDLLERRAKEEVR